MEKKRYEWKGSGKVVALDATAVGETAKEINEPHLWYITRTNGSELYVLRLPEDTLITVSRIEHAIFPVAFATEQEAQLVVNFIEKVVDKAVAANVEKVSAAVVERLKSLFAKAQSAGS